METDGGSAPEDDAGNPDHPAVEDDRVYLVPYRWLKEAQESSAGVEDADTLFGSRGILYSTSPASTTYSGTMKILTNFFNSDLAFNIQREDDSGNDAEAGFSGRIYALIRTDMWSKALKWHHDSSLMAMGVANHVSAADGSVTDVYALMLKISVARETSVMTVKISKKDNTIEHYRRASKIFSLDSELVYIWDFSGQTTLILMNERNKLHKDCQRQSDQEICLVLHVYALSEFLTSQTEGRKDELTVQQSKTVSTHGGSLVCNSNKEFVDSNSFVTNSYFLNGSSRALGSLGLTGLENLGNTCFMNSAIQCLAHTPKLVDFFLGDYNKEINPHNPLGMDGELASAFGELLRKLWSSERKPVTPRLFKTVLARFAPQFSGFNQHDSQELLAFLLDGLHEDLNRVKCKPYIEAKDALDRPDEEVANEYWANHLARNDSIIVDVCQGQYRSTLVCPVCNKVSVTFDPFMYLSLPLPSTTMRTMTVTVLSTDGSSEPSPLTITVPKYGKCKDLLQSLSIACSLRDDECLLLAEVYANRIIRYLEEFSDSLTLIRDHDRLAAYRLPKDLEKLPLVVFTHQREEHYKLSAKAHWKAFGVPLVTRISGNLTGPSIQNLFLKLLNPFLRSRVGSVGNQDNGESTSSDDIAKSEIAGSSPMTECKGKTDLTDEATANLEGESTPAGSGLEFYLTDDKGLIMHSKIEMNEQLPLTGLQKQLHVLVCWPEKELVQYDTYMLNSLPEIQKFGFLPKWPQDSISLYACIEAFLKEEPLGPEDMWYCPPCKMHRQASKKLDLWRLPDVLVIHLKRFSYSRFLKNKLETFVDFPIHDLDLSTYIACKNEDQLNRYELYAVSNHYGSMGGGHYTAYVHHAGENQWYDFDDRHVVSIPENNIKTSAAYVLFYKRVHTIKSDT